jgi:hypothetical protein
MKIKTAITLINMREKILRDKYLLKSNKVFEPKRLINVQTVLEKNDIALLKEKTGETTISNALLKAIYFCLEYEGEIII